MNALPESGAPDADRGTLLVLGASADIGLEIIRQQAPTQDRILAHYHRSGAKLDQLRRELPGANLVPIQADLAQASELDALVAKLRELAPLPDKIVHLPAPPLEYLRFKQLGWEHFQQYFDVQLRSLVAVLQAVLPEIARRKRGKVVVVLSSCTLGVPPGAMAHYVTAKYALWGLTRALAAEYSSQRLNINAVSPSMVETAFLRNVDERMVEITAGQAPFQRSASRQDVAGAVRFLLSAESDYITGVNLPVTGGSVF